MRGMSTICTARSVVISKERPVVRAEACAPLEPTLHAMGGRSQNGCFHAVKGPAPAIPFPSVTRQPGRQGGHLPLQEIQGWCLWSGSPSFIPPPVLARRTIQPLYETDAVDGNVGSVLQASSAVHRHTTSMWIRRIRQGGSSNDFSLPSLLEIGWAKA